MILAYFIILLISLIGIKVNLAGFNDEYASKNSTLCVKGLFVLFVFCRHFKQYAIFDDSLLDQLFIKADYLLWQLIVVMFLFYSGYGIITQIKESLGGT